MNSHLPAPISIHPASGIIISLGRGMQALSMVIKTTTPGHPMDW
jgi:hypothetical protein